MSKTDIKMVFVAREDSSMPNSKNTHTNEDIAEVFDSRERLKDPVAAQQIVGDIECDAPPPGKLKNKKYHLDLKKQGDLRKCFILIAVALL